MKMSANNTWEASSGSITEERVHQKYWDIRETWFDSLGHEAEAASRVCGKLKSGQPQTRGTRQTRWGGPNITQASSDRGE